MLQHLLVLAAAPAATATMYVRLPATAATIVSTIVLLWIIRMIGHRIGRADKFDNVARVVIAVFGVGGVLTVFRPFRALGDAINVAINSGAANAGLKGAVGIFPIATLVVAAIGMWLYYKRASMINLVWLAVLSVPLFSLHWARALSDWYIAHIGVPAFNFLVGVWNFVAR